MRRRVTKDVAIGILHERKAWLDDRIDYEVSESDCDDDYLHGMIEESEALNQAIRSLGFQVGWTSVSAEDPPEDVPLAICFVDVHGKITVRPGSFDNGKFRMKGMHKDHQILYWLVLPAPPMEENE